MYCASAAASFRSRPVPGARDLSARASRRVGGTAAAAATTTTSTAAARRLRRARPYYTESRRQLTDKTGRVRARFLLSFLTSCMHC